MNQEGTLGGAEEDGLSAVPASLVTDVTKSMLQKLSGVASVGPQSGMAGDSVTPPKEEGVQSFLAPLTSEELQEEVRLLPRRPDDCYSIQAARWVTGERTGLTFAGVLHAERGRRMGFSREAVLKETYTNIDRLVIRRI